MDAAQLIAEGLRLARPSLVLRTGPRRERPVGFWRGDGVVPLSGGKHWVSVDCSWLAQQGFPVGGCLSLYEQDVLRFVAVMDATATMPATNGESIPLFGQEEPSIPPCEALDVCGSDLARDWFAAGGGAPIGEAYDREYQRRCPLWRDDVVAVLGGWHTFWPDSDDYKAQPGRLVLWTFRDAEPWVEVWTDESGSLRAVPRITDRRADANSTAGADAWHNT